MAKYLSCTRVNPTTNELDYFFPMEITDPADREYARLNGLKVGMAMLGFRKFEAVMIPCKHKTHDSMGREIFLDTPSNEQRRIFQAYAQDELARQERMKQDGRCQIPSANRKSLKRCPLRIPNPAYVPGGEQPKTLAVKCEECPFEQFKQAHTVIELSCLDNVDEDGDTESYEVPAPLNYDAGNRYEEISEAFVAYVAKRKPRLAALAEKMVQECTLAEASKDLGKPDSTLFSQKEQLKILMKQFFDEVII